MTKPVLIYYVPKSEIDGLWKTISPMIQKALDHASGELELEDVRKRALDGMAGILVIYQNSRIVASCVIEFTDYCRLSAMRVVALGGEGMDNWIDDLLSFLEMWAAENGLSRIEHLGREGWVRVLKSRGWKATYTFMTKEIQWEKVRVQAQK